MSGYILQTQLVKIFQLSVPPSNNPRFGRECLIFFLSRPALSAKSPGILRSIVNLQTRA